jgi:hypothetical protein
MGCGGKNREKRWLISFQKPMAGSLKPWSIVTEAHGRNGPANVWRQRQLPFASFTGHGVGEPQFMGMQGLALYVRVDFSTIERIPDQWVAQMGQVNPNLMGSTG